MPRWLSARSSSSDDSGQASVGDVLGYCCGTWYGCVGVRVFLWRDERRDRVHAAVHTRSTFSTEKSDWHIELNRRRFPTGCANRIAQSKEFEWKKLLIDWKKPDVVSSPVENSLS